MELFNIALLGKIAWRILTKPHCLLSRILLGKYCHSKSFLSVPSQGGSSHGWKGIIAGRDLLISHLGKSIGDGESTKVWKDSWIDNGSNTRPFGPSTLQDQDLLVADLLSRETREWNVAKINRTLPELAERILRIRPSRLGTHDTYIWNLKSSGEYTTKTGYMALTQNIAEVSSPATTNSIDWRKLVWSNRTAPKIKLFLWKSLHEALPTGFNLQKRRMRENTACGRCGAIETTDHLLF